MEIIYNKHEVIYITQKLKSPCRWSLLGLFLGHLPGTWVQVSVVFQISTLHLIPLLMKNCPKPGLRQRVFFFYDVIHSLLLGKKLRFVIKCLSSFTLNFNKIKTSSGQLPTHLLS